jgi:hypothetical protein
MQRFPSEPLITEALPKQPQKQLQGGPRAAPPITNGMLICMSIEHVLR